MPIKERLGLDDNSPLWINVVAKIGVPAAIAIYLVYFLTNSLTNNINRVNDSLNKMNTTLSAHAIADADAAANAEKNMQENRRIYYMLRTICVNQAKNMSERSECFK